MTKFAIIGRILALTVCVSLCAGVVSAGGPEEELGPEKMAIADEIVEKVIYGIRFEKLKGEKIRAVIKAWTDYYGKEGLLNKREAMMMQVYIGRAATMHQQGIPHVPYAERQKQ